MILLPVRVHPGASRDALHLLDNGILDVRLRARAVEGKANQALVTLLAAWLRLPSREVRIARGERARQKLVEVELPSLEQLRARLEAG
jgi:uncharacterized protein (TIGR00251 family)